MLIELQIKSSLISVNLSNWLVFVNLAVGIIGGIISKTNFRKLRNICGLMIMIQLSMFLVLYLFRYSKLDDFVVGGSILISYLAVLVGFFSIELKSSRFFKNLGIGVYWTIIFLYTILSNSMLKEFYSLHSSERIYYIFWFINTLIGIIGVIISKLNSSKIRKAIKVHIFFHIIFILSFEFDVDFLIPFFGNFFFLITLVFAWSIFNKELIKEFNVHPSSAVKN